jgi:hypothetical protein
LLGGERWVDHYGEVIITNHTANIVCKLTFVKVGLNVLHQLEKFRSFFTQASGALNFILTCMLL